MKKFLIHICLLLSVLVFNCQTTTNKNVTRLTPEEFQSSINNDSIQLIDVRKPSEFVTGHIPNAVNMPPKVIVFNASELSNPAATAIKAKNTNSITHIPDLA